MTTEEKDKLELLLDMTEHPERYSEQELERLLDDGECRELYQLMTEANQAFEVRKAERVTDEVMQEEWEKFAGRHYPASDTKMPAPASAFRKLRKLAAMLIGVVMLSGMAYAAVYISKMQHREKAPEKKEVTATATASKPVMAQTEDRRDTVTVQPRQFENVALEQIVSELAARYMLKVEFRNEKAKAVRLYFQWNPQDSAAKVVETLNMFNQVRVSIVDGTIIVE